MSQEVHRINPNFHDHSFSLVSYRFSFLCLFSLSVTIFSRCCGTFLPSFLLLLLLPFNTFANLCCRFFLTEDQSTRRQCVWDRVGGGGNSASLHPNTGEHKQGWRGGSQGKTGTQFCWAVSGLLGGSRGNATGNLGNPLDSDFSSVCLVSILSWYSEKRFCRGESSCRGTVKSGQTQREKHCMWGPGATSWESPGEGRPRGRKITDFKTKPGLPQWSSS